MTAKDSVLPFLKGREEAGSRSRSPAGQHPAASWMSPVAEPSPGSPARAVLHSWVIMGARAIGL